MILSILQNKVLLTNISLIKTTISVAKVKPKLIKTSSKKRFLL